MRANAYHLFEIVAWPAVVWCGIELLLRSATSNFDGAATTAATGALAGLTVASCRIRANSLLR